jgi:hypothetical protein
MKFLLGWEILWRFVGFFGNFLEKEVILNSQFLILTKPFVLGI